LSRAGQSRGQEKRKGERAQRDGDELAARRG
jgi:hypothetical protein